MRKSGGIVVVVVAFAFAVAACSSDDGDDGVATPSCGDAACNGDETFASCPGDCPAVPRCGDGVCSGGETSASCPGDCPAQPRCGDGSCNGSESTASCPGDCPPQACTFDPASCSGDTICLNGSCVAAFGRAYRVVAWSAEVPQFNPNGQPWDPVGGLPDPYAVITLNGVALGTTTALQDTLTPVWNEGTNPTNIPAGSTVRLDVYDEDVDAPDGIVACVLSPLTADHLRLGDVQRRAGDGDDRILDAVIGHGSFFQEAATLALAAEPATRSPWR